MALSDEQLARQYLEGDEKSLEILIDRHLKPVYNFIYHFVGSVPDAEDITQEVFVRVWRNLNKFNQQKKFKTWFYSIAKNAALDFLKKKKSVPFSTFENDDGENALLGAIPDPGPLPEELLARADIEKQLTLAISLLAPKYRATLVLHYHEQFTLQEIAALMDEPLNTVKSRHLRALGALKKFLLEYDNAPKSTSQS